MILTDLGLKGVVIFLDLGGLSIRRKECSGAFAKRVQCSAQPPPPPAWPGRAVAEPGRQSWDGPKPISIVGSTGSIGTQVGKFWNGLKDLLKLCFQS